MTPAQTNETPAQAQAAVDAEILEIVLPHLYSIIDKLLDGNPDKALIVRARRLLPRGYKNSFEKLKENS